MVDMGNCINALDMHVATKMAALRGKQALEIDKVSDAIGLSVARYMAYESGHERISARELYLLGRQFNVSLQYFFEGMDRDSTQPSAGHPAAGEVAT